MSKINNTKITHSIVYGLGILAILALGTSIMPVKVSAQNSDYYDDGYDHFLAPSQNPIPLVYSLSPSFGSSGNSATTITISGHGFMPNSVARWNGSNRSTTFIDSDHLLIHLSANDLTGLNGRYVNVFNPNRGAYSNAILFKIKGYVAPTSGNSNTSTDPNSNLYSNQSNTNTNSNSLNTSTGNESTPSESNNSESSLAASVIFGSNGVMPSGLIQWILLAIVILLIVILVRKISGGAERYHNEPLKHA